MILRRFARGFFAPWDGLRRLRHDPKLRRLALLPLLVTAVTFTISFVVAIFGAVKSYEAFAEYGAGWSPWLRYPAEGLLVFALLFASVLGAAVAAVLLSKMIGGVLFGRLARAAESGGGAEAAVERTVSLGRRERCFAIAASVRDRKCFAVGIGSRSRGGAGGGVARHHSLEWVAPRLRVFCVSVGLRGLRRRDVLGFARQHRWETLGLGVSVFLLSLVPIVGWVGIIAGVVGSVALRHDLAAKTAGGVTQLPGPKGRGH